MQIEDFCQENGVEFRRHGEHHHCTFGFIQMDCPNCSPKSGRFRLGWNLRGQYFSCWRCGKLPAVNTWSLLTGVHPRQIYRLLGHDFGSRDTLHDVRKAPGKLVLPKGLGPLQKCHLEYLISRGFRNLKQTIETWQLQGIDHTNPELAWRIFIPVIYDGEVISWTARATSDHNPRRYITASDEQQKFSLKDILFGADLANNTVIVVEGPLDAIKIGPGAVALCGMTWTKAQLLAISKYPNRIICFDGEPAALDRAHKLANELMVFEGITNYVELKKGQDPASLSKSQIAELREFLK